MQATHAGPTSSEAGPLSCAKPGREPTSFELAERAISLPILLADRDLDGYHKLVLIAVQLAAGDGDECNPDDADLAAMTGLYHDDGRANKRFLHRVINELEDAGWLRRKYPPNGRKRIGIILNGPRITLAPDPTSTLTLIQAARSSQAPMSRVTQHPASGIPTPRTAPELPRALTGPELGRFERLCEASRQSRTVEGRYEAARYAIGIIDPGGSDARLTVPKVSQVLGDAWRRGPQTLKRKEDREIAAALVSGGIILKRVPNFAGG